MRVYPGSQFNDTTAHLECCLSPYHTPDFYMRRFPKTCLIAGGFDPLLDDGKHCLFMEYCINTDTYIVLYQRWTLTRVSVEWEWNLSCMLSPHSHTVS